MDRTSDVARFVAACPENIRDVVTALRSASLSTLDGLHEIVYRGAINYTSSGRPAARVVYIAPKRGYVNLGFFAGTRLHDPKKLLVGTGERMRHVKVNTALVAKSEPVRALLIAARDAAMNGAVRP